MQDILHCGYLKQGINALISDYPIGTDALQIIQIMSESGQVNIGDNSYPITYGGLYFINGSDKYGIIPKKENEYKSSNIILSKKFIKNLGNMLDCSELYNDIFGEDGGFYLPIKNYKTLDTRFKRISSVYNSNKPYSKALVTSDIIQLLNYAVYNMTK